jgi:hypothetical protein
MPQVFLSWSGTRSECLARYVHSSLPTIVPGLKVFYSPAIDPGAIWNNSFRRLFASRGLPSSVSRMRIFRLLGFTSRRAHSGNDPLEVVPSVRCC